MKAFQGHHGSGQEQVGQLTGRFWARVWDMDCVLELHLDDSGGLSGWFSADDAELEVAGQTRSADGVLVGSIRAHALREAFASFEARVDAEGLFLEVDLRSAEFTEHATFTRLSEASTP